ncbi:hypothetical protein EG329_006226 [Mollisiaceae sp. DMI_Dod_QoI]|nr:hypothetical protein EG329_006226 [Helotiales sp. DMI_Dod_QoI]
MSIVQASLNESSAASTSKETLIAGALRDALEINAIRQTSSDSDDVAPPQHPDAKLPSGRNMSDIPSHDSHPPCLKESRAFESKNPLRCLNERSPTFLAFRLSLSGFCSVENRQD